MYDKAFEMAIAAQESAVTERLASNPKLRTRPILDQMNPSLRLLTKAKNLPTDYVQYGSMNSYICTPSASELTSPIDQFSNHSHSPFGYTGSALQDTSLRAAIPRMRREIAQGKAAFNLLARHAASLQYITNQAPPSGRYLAVRTMWAVAGAFNPGNSVDLVGELSDGDVSIFFRLDLLGRGQPRNQVSVTPAAYAVGQEVSVTGDPYGSWLVSPYPGTLAPFPRPHHYDRPILSVFVFDQYSFRRVRDKAAEHYTPLLSSDLHNFQLKSVGVSIAADAGHELVVHQLDLLSLDQGSYVPYP